MKRIGLSQRVDVVPAYGERRDALDQQWAHLLAGLGWLPVPLASGLANVAAAVDALGLDGIILTGGNDLAGAPGASNVAPERDALETALIGCATRRGMPLLGVCRGMQALAVHYGAGLVPVDGHVRSAHDVQLTGMLRDLYGATRQVVCYHGLAVDAARLPADLEPLGRSDDGTLEALAHRRHRQVGIMWHPERARPFDNGDAALLRRLFEES